MDKQTSAKKPRILVKYGGNAMIDENLRQSVLKSICSIKNRGFDIILVHGGGPFIKAALQQAGIEAEFVDGHRKTPPEAFRIVETTLKGQVNSDIVRGLTQCGALAVGISGRDGKSVVAAKREHTTNADGEIQTVDLGRVGDVAEVNPGLIELLVENQFIPVIACIAADEDGVGYNVNADMFAGNLAAALKVHQYLVLTDVDGLYRDKDDPSTRIPSITDEEVRMMLNEGKVQGGMIPKLESCEIALSKGALSASIINGTKPAQIAEAVDKGPVGTVIFREQVN